MATDPQRQARLDFLGELLDQLSSTAAAFGGGESMSVEQLDTKLRTIADGIGKAIASTDPQAAQRAREIAGHEQSQARKRARDAAFAQIHWPLDLSADLAQRRARGER